MVINHPITAEVGFDGKTEPSRQPVECTAAKPASASR